MRHTIVGGLCASFLFLTEAYATIPPFITTRENYTMAKEDQIEMEGGQRGYRVRAIIPIVRKKPINSKADSTKDVEDKYFLQLVRYIPTPLAKNIFAVESAYSEYQEKSLGRSGLRKMFVGTLTLTLFFAVFVAITCTTPPATAK